jgi:hypothetical protein
MNSRIIPVTDFIRKFGDWAKILPEMDEIILTREGRPFATVKAAAERKNGKLLSLAGLWKNTKLDNDSVWKRVLTRGNRKYPVKI